MTTEPEHIADAELYELRRLERMVRATVAAMRRDPAGRDHYRRLDTLDDQLYTLDRLRGGPR